MKKLRNFLGGALLLALAALASFALVTGAHIYALAVSVALPFIIVGMLVANAMRDAAEARRHRAGLRARHPGLSDEEIDRHMRSQVRMVPSDKSVDPDE